MKPLIIKLLYGKNKELRRHKHRVPMLAGNVISHPEAAGRFICDSTDTCPGSVCKHNQLFFPAVHLYFHTARRMHLRFLFA